MSKLGCSFRDDLGLLAVFFTAALFWPACQTDLDPAYVKVTLQPGAKTALAGGHVALSLVAGTNEAQCGPQWGLGTWGAKPPCKDSWVSVDEFSDLSRVWKIDSQGKYDWVVVILEIFDQDGHARIRTAKTLQFGKGQEWDVTVSLQSLCSDLARGECCNESGSAIECVSGDLSFPQVLSGFPNGWCTVGTFDSGTTISHSDCKIIQQ